MDVQLPDLLQLFSEKLHYHIRPLKPALGFHTFVIDLSSWKLRLSHHNPVVWVKKEELENSPPHHLAESLKDVIRERVWHRRTIIVLLDGFSDSLSTHLKDSLEDFVIIDRGVQERILTSRRPSGALRDVITEQVSISNLAPYEISSPVTGSRFFGRDYELKRILRSSETNHAILGIRRIGKTSLLREVERQLREEEDGEASYIVYLDCSDSLSTDDFVREVVRKLHLKELPRLHLQKYAFFFPNFLERMRRMHKHKIVFLLDEIDNLVIMQQGNWDLFRMLRASSNKGVCQYIVAGYREARKDLYDQNSPFYNFAEPLLLSEFMTTEATELIIKPMENLGVRFKNRNEIVSRIYHETAGHPNLIQYYCLILVRQLERLNKREVTPENLIDIYSDEGFKNHLISSFLQNTSQREKALVFSILAETDNPNRGFSQSYMDAMLRRQGLVFKQTEIQAACSVLILAGIFQQNTQDFFFTSPVFVRVLQQFHNIEYLLRKVKEEGV